MITCSRWTTNELYISQTNIFIILCEGYDFEIVSGGVIIKTSLYYAKIKISVKVK